MLNFQFFLNSALLGVGLAMDAFSVSLANGLNEPNMQKNRQCAIASIFSLFQFTMPMLGWVCVSTVAQYFSAFEKCIPWIALFLLCFLGGKTILESLKDKEQSQEFLTLTLGTLLLQGLATSIDALSIGFTIANYNLFEALLCCSIIGILTFFLCFIGIEIGKKFGTKLANKAGIFGGIILILIGLEIFITSFL